MSSFVLPKGVFRISQAPEIADIPFPYGLGVQGVHEVCETAFGDCTAATGIVFAAMPPAQGPIAWVSTRKMRQEHGCLLEAGLGALIRQWPPILYIDANKPTDALWALEEAVVSGAASLVVGELSELDFTATRRLRLASVRRGVPLILLLPHTREGATAACARWRVAPRASGPNPYDHGAPGALRWQITLERSRTMPTASGTVFDLELHDETLSLGVVSRLAPDPVATGPLCKSPRGKGADIHRLTG